MYLKSLRQNIKRKGSRGFDFKYKKMKKLYEINGEITNNSGRKVVIFGTGEWGKRAFFTLLADDIRIDYFADQKKGDYKLFERIILSEDELVGKDYIVIIASSHNKEIYDRLDGKGIKNLYIIERFSLQFGLEI